MTKTFDLLARHVQFADFNNVGKCAIATAIKEQISCDFVNAGFHTVNINGKLYTMKPSYLKDDYEKDVKEFEKQSGDEFIRKYTLTIK